MAGVQAGRLSIEIVAEIARLQSDLDKAKKLVNAASGEIAKSTKAANDNLAGLSGGMAKAAPSAKLAAFGMRNLAFQAQDLGVQLTMAANSSKPLQGALMAFAMQGPQIRDAFKQTGQSVTGLIAGFVRAHPLITAFVAAAGLAAGAMKMFTSEVNKSGELDRYAKSLGLTAKEMKKLEDVGVTTGDVFTGLWRVLNRYLGITKIFAEVKAVLVDTFKTGMNWAMNFYAALYAAIGGTIKLFGTLAKAAKQALTGDFAGALTTVVMGNVGDSYADAFKEAKGRLRKLGGEIGQEIIGASKDRIAGQAKVLIDDRTAAKAKKEAKTLGEMMGETIAETMRNLNNMGQIVNGTDVLSERMKTEEQVREQQKQADQDGRERWDKWYADLDRERRDRALKAAYEVADIIGGSVGNGLARLIEVLDAKFKDLFKNLFDALGEFGKVFKEWLKGAAVGAAAAKLTGGSAIGGMFGGAIGKAGGEILGKSLGALGKFAGPLGAIAGGILGGVVGGLFKKVKKASATIEIMAGQAAQTALSGNSSKLKAVAGAMADSLIGGLMGIADQLGGMLGDGIRVSIGQRKNTFRVDLAGLGRTKNMPSFATEEEAVAFAIQSVIRQGAITGLRAGTETLLKGQGDLEAQLQKALSFENVFRELEQRANPTIAGLDAIAKEFTQLIDIFEEAGATTEDYARLTELMALKQKDAIEAAFDPIRTLLDDLKGKADAAGDAVRTAFDAALSREASAIEAYENARIEAFGAGQQRWLDAVTTGFTEEIDRIKDAIGPLREQASALAQTAERLRDFSAELAGEIGGNIRFSASAATAAAQAGDIDRLGALREAAMSGATDRFSQVRNLAILRNATNDAAGGFAGRASGIEAQIALMEEQVGGIEQQVELAKSQASALESVQQGVTDIAQLFAEMQTAVAAADLAREQMAKLTELTDVELSFTEAVAAYEAAKVTRDDLMRDITAAGFASLIEVQKQTGSQLVAALSDAAAKAAMATSAATAAIAAAQAAAAVVNDNAPWMDYLNIPGFAGGGMHSGGLRVVGENGPEIEATGPARYWTRDQMAGAGADPREIGKAVAESLTPVLYPMIRAMVKMEARTQRWDGDGIPAERVVA